MEDGALAKLYANLHRSLHDRSPAESNALVDEILRADRANPKSNRLGSGAYAHLHLLKLHNHFRAGDTEAAICEAKAAMAFSPCDLNASRQYEGLLRTQRSEAPACFLLIISCEKYLERATALARRLGSIPEATVQVVVSAQARVPANPAFLTVDAADDYEALPYKVRGAFVRVFETCAAGTCVFKIDDDLEIADQRRFADAVRRIAGARHDYVGASIGTEPIDRTWHFKKCTDPAIDRTPYGKRVLAPYANGPFYFLSARALRTFVLATLRYPAEIQGELFEDKFVGDTLWREGIALHEVTFPALGLAPL